MNETGAMPVSSEIESIVTRRKNGPATDVAGPLYWFHKGIERSSSPETQEGQEIFNVGITISIDIAIHGVVHRKITHHPNGFFPTQIESPVCPSSNTLYTLWPAPPEQSQWSAR